MREYRETVELYGRRYTFVEGERHPTVNRLVVEYLQYREKNFMNELERDLICFDYDLLGLELVE